MINLRQAIVAIQRLENSAAEKVGMRLILMEDARLFAKDRAKYAALIAELLIKDCEDEIREAVEIAGPIARAVGTPSPMTDGSAFIAYFKMTAAMLIGQMADRLTIKIARNRTIGVEESVISEWRRDPKSILNIERFNLTKAVKREMAGVINRIFQAQIVGAVRNG